MDARVAGRLNSRSHDRVYEPEALGVPKRKGRQKREVCGGPEGPRTPSTSRQPGIPKAENPFTRNVFIDSYYPVFGDCSEDPSDSSKKTQEKSSSDDSAPKDMPPFRNLYPKEEAFPRERREIPEVHFKKIFSANPPFRRCQNKRSEEVEGRRRAEAVPRRASSSTVDSKTFTIYSYMSSPSDVRSNWRIREEERQKTANRKILESDVKDEDEKEIDGSPSTSSAIECFIRLHKRIETLEELLQKTLDIQNTNTPKVAPMPEKKVEEREESDTEKELEQIKERLKILERRLKGGQRGEARPRDLEKPHSTNDDPTVTTEIFEKMNSGRKGASRHPPVNTDLFCPSNTSLFSNTREAFGGNQISGPDTFCKKHEVKKNFMSECKKLKKKCGNMIGAGGKSWKVDKHSGKIENQQEEWSLTKTSEKLVFRCSSFALRPNEDSESLSGARPVRVRHQKNKLTPSEGKSRKKRKRKGSHVTKNLCKKNSKTNILLLQNKESQNELCASPNVCNGNDIDKKEDKEDRGTCSQVPEAIEKIQDEPKRLELPEFEGVIYSGTAEKGCLVPEDPGKELLEKTIPDTLWRPRPGYNSRCWATCPVWTTFPNNCCPRPPFQECDYPLTPGYDLEEVKKESKKRELYRNPLDVLKRGGKIKIPVLFEELCKTPKTKEVVRKPSDISMRFVLVEENNQNPLNPLRKLIKKLSRTNSNKRAEQYVFGMTNCCYDNEIYKLGPIPNKKFLKKFGYG